MKKPEEVIRNFKKSDEELLQQSDVKLASFIKNKSRFVERFPQLADPFATEWKEATSNAREILPDYASVSYQVNSTEALNAQIEEGANLYQSLLLYVRLAFSDDATALSLFGQPQYAAASRSAIKLPLLLRTAFLQASKPEFKDALTGKGMKLAEIDQLLTMADSIVDLDIAQDNAIKQRKLDAFNRITALNAIWERITLVCFCAKLVFQKDATRYNLFLLNDGDNPEKKPEE